MTYDAVIAGAGIAGLYCGWKLAAAGMKVRIVDRRKRIGLPVYCGEATGSRAELARFMPVEESWICRDVAGLTVHVNDAPPVARRLDDLGLVLHRDRFEQRLAEHANRAGAQITLERAVTGLSGTGPRYDGIILDKGETVRGTLIIGADGPESRIGRLAGITRVLAPSDAFSGAQYRLESDYCDDGTFHFFVGSETIPRGYIWVFPKDGGWISAGAGFYGPALPGVRALELLDRFITDRIGACRKEKLICGCVPLVVCPKRLHAGTVAVVGDAARQANPLTAGGIMNTLEAADLLVGSLLKRRGRCGFDAALAHYSRSWAQGQRRIQFAFKYAQKLACTIDDAETAALVRHIDTAFRMPIDRTRPFTWPVPTMLRLFFLCSGIIFRRRFRSADSPTTVSG